MRALPRPMGAGHRVPLIFAVNVVIVSVVVAAPLAVLHLLADLGPGRKKRNARDASEAMTQLRKCYRYYLPSSPRGSPEPHAPFVRSARSSYANGPTLEATLRSFQLALVFVAGKFTSVLDCFANEGTSMLLGECNCSLPSPSSLRVLAKRDPREEDLEGNAEAELKDETLLSPEIPPIPCSPFSPRSSLNFVPLFPPPSPLYTLPRLPQCLHFHAQRSLH